MVSILDKDKISPLGESHHIIHHGSTGRVGWLSAALEEPRVDPLAYDHVGELQPVLLQPDLLETVLGRE